MEHGIDLDLNESMETILTVKEKLYTIKDKELRTSILLMIDIVHHMHIHLSEDDRLAHVENVKANIKMLNHWVHVNKRLKGLKR